MAQDCGGLDGHGVDAGVRVASRSVGAVWTGLFSLVFLMVMTGCAARAPRNATLSVMQATPLLTNALQGDLAPVHDPSIYLQGGTYYLFSTDPADPKPNQFLPIRCSSDLVSWRMCGQVFTTIPAWVSAAVPRIGTLWAPDISYFNGLYHLYYAGSLLGSQNSVMGLATNVTLDPTDPKYEWVDRGEVLESHRGEDFNAIDPNILVDRSGRVWMQYGSYWTGIKQREIDSRTGMFLASAKVRYELAARPLVKDDAIEGPSLVRHGGLYYLFLSVDHCCEDRTSKDDYKEIVGRSSSPHGPFLDRLGVPLTRGGGSIVLAGNERWLAPGGATVYVNPQTEDSVLVFHALDMSDRASPSLWVKRLTWENGWPVLE